MVKPLWIIANWKAHKTIEEGINWINQVGPNLPYQENIKVVVCPTVLAVEEIKKAVLVGNYPILVGVQDLSPFSEGSYTGEEAASLMNTIVDAAIVGHSERRREFGETDEMVAEKVEMAKANSIIPIVCVEASDVPVPTGTSVVAFEPVSSIGTGNADTPAHAGEVATEIRQKWGDYLEVLYGGSVTPENAEEFLSQNELNGLLIGGASLDPESFSKIIEIAVSLNGKT